MPVNTETTTDISDIFIQAYLRQSHDKYIPTAQINLEKKVSEKMRQTEMVILRNPSYRAENGLKYDGYLAWFYIHDPAGQYANPYLYGGNNPLIGVDPDGEFFWLVGALVAAWDWEHGCFKDLSKLDTWGDIAFGAALGFGVDMAVGAFADYAAKYGMDIGASFQYNIDVMVDGSYQSINALGASWSTAEGFAWTGLAAWGIDSAVKAYQDWDKGNRQRERQANRGIMDKYSPDSLYSFTEAIDSYMDSANPLKQRPNLSDMTPDQVTDYIDNKMLPGMYQRLARIGDVTLSLVTIGKSVLGRAIKGSFKQAAKSYLKGLPQNAGKEFLKNHMENVIESVE